MVNSTEFRVDCTGQKGSFLFAPLPAQTVLASQGSAQITLLSNVASRKGPFLSGTVGYVNPAAVLRLRPGISRDYSDDGKCGARQRSIFDQKRCVATW